MPVPQPDYNPYGTPPLLPPFGEKTSYEPSAPPEETNYEPSAPPEETNYEPSAPPEETNYNPSVPPLEETSRRLSYTPTGLLKELEKYKNNSRQREAIIGDAVHFLNGDDLFTFHRNLKEASDSDFLLEELKKKKGVTEDEISHHEGLKAQKVEYAQCVVLQRQSGGASSSQNSGHGSDVDASKNHLSSLTDADQTDELQKENGSKNSQSSGNGTGVHASKEPSPSLTGADQTPVNSDAWSWCPNFMTFRSLLLNFFKGVYNLFTCCFGSRSGKGSEQNGQKGGSSPSSFWDSKEKADSISGSGRQYNHYVG